MSDTYNAFTVVLEKDLSREAADALMSAIRQLRGVLSVDGNVVDIISDHVAQERVRNDIAKKLFSVLSQK